MPKGIPDITRIRPIPALPNAGERWRLNIQEHKAKRAGLHYDLRLNPPGTTHAHSWAVKGGLPTPGSKTLAVIQPTHHSEYMGWSGTLTDGYGAGEVRSIVDEPVRILSSSEDEINFVRTSSGGTPMRFMLKRVGERNWLLYNYTKVTGDDIVPSTKPKYKEIRLSDVRSDIQNEILSPKVDGAHNAIILRPNKRVDVYSYRRSKKQKDPDTQAPSGIIDHTYKTDLYKIRSPRELGNTVVRAELFIPGQSAARTAGVLNSNTEKALQTQRSIGKLQTMIFDVDQYKGKDVSNLPYAQKLHILREINNAIPELTLPELARTQQEKLKLIDDVKHGRHPETKEGVIVYNLDKPTPVKAKVKHDYDVLIVGTYPAAAGSKYHGNAIGGFIGVPENRKIRIRIGSGLSDALRRSAYQNPERFIGQWAVVEGQEEFASGKFRMPIFKGFRAEKYG